MCTAGIDLETGECLRPFPHLKTSFCRDLGILPGALFSAFFTPIPDRSAPHTEDSFCNELLVEGSVSSDQLQAILQKNASTTLDTGFRATLPVGEKYFSKNAPPHLSLITLKVKPTQAHLHPGLKPGTLRMHFYDNGGRSVKNIPVTDLRFHRLAQQHQENEFYNALNKELFSMKEVFLRLGLTRSYINEQGKEGFWLQVNGIYTFPEKLSTLPQNPF